MNLRSKNKVSVEFAMSSMTDVVFLLLIFFMVTSTLVSPNAIKLLFPQKKAEVVEEKPTEVILSVNQIAENDYAYKIDANSVSFEELSEQLIAQMESLENAVIILKTGDNVPVDEAVRLINLAKDYEFRIIFSMKN